MLRILMEDARRASIREARPPIGGSFNCSSSPGAGPTLDSSTHHGHAVAGIGWAELSGLDQLEVLALGSTAQAMRAFLAAMAMTAFQ